MKSAVKLSTLCLLLLGGCLKHESGNPSQPEQEYPISDKFMMQEPYDVPLQNGKVAVVTFNNDTLAITDIPLTFQAPLGTGTRAASALQVKHVDYAELPEFTAGTSITVGEHELWFEDSRNGDYDYNDVVLHVRIKELTHENKMNVFTVNVRGIALGSARQIGFGITDINNVDFDLTNDVRRDYFAGNTGFINTVKGSPFQACIAAGDQDDQDMGDYVIKHRSERVPENPKYLTPGYVKYPAIATSVSTTSNVRVGFRFYIKLGKEKIYAGEYDKNTAGALPYGIRMTTGHNHYPAEVAGVNAAFPQFVNWILTGSPTDWNSEANADLSKCYSLDKNFRWVW